jgi:IS1 family transposase
MKYDKMLQKYIADILDVSEKTIVDWGNFMRETISHFFLEKPLVLGKHHAVQIDESLFGGRRKYNRGDHHVHKKSWVFGMVEEESNLCVFWAVKDRTKDTLLELIKSHIAQGAIIKSDEWRSYASLGEEGYNHLTVNHSLKFVDESGVHTQLIESMWSQLKSIIKVKRGSTGNHLAGILDFYSFLCLAKYKRKKPLDAFLELIQAGHCY